MKGMGRGWDGAENERWCQTIVSLSRWQGHVLPVRTAVSEGEIVPHSTGQMLTILKKELFGPWRLQLWKIVKVTSGACCWQCSPQLACSSFLSWSGRAAWSLPPVVRPLLMISYTQVCFNLIFLWDYLNELLCTYILHLRIFFTKWQLKCYIAQAWKGRQWEFHF